jgi:ribosome biogenesis protein SSF1/2
MWTTAPLVVMAGFSGGDHLRLASTMFQNLFPPINVQTVGLSSCQRVVMLEHDKATGRISMRHYSISVVPSGVSKGLKALLSGKALPDLGGLADASEFLTRGGRDSDSEGEEAGQAKVTLAQDLGSGNIAARQSRVRLHEVGPRLELEIVKVEAGMCEGAVLYHAYEKRSAAEAEAQEEEAKKKRKERTERRRQQEENVRKKKRERGDTEEDGRKKGKKKKQWWEENDGVVRGRAGDSDDDAEYFRKEVGEEPDDAGSRPMRGDGKQRTKGGKEGRKRSFDGPRKGSGGVGKGSFKGGKDTGRGGWKDKKRKS